jgi:5-methylcytosine-specific restriction protein A
MADQAHIKRERAKARELRDSQWWKNQIGPGICYHCGKKFPKSQLTMDHLTPLARGGKTTKSNVVPSCKACNQTRGQKLDVERAFDAMTDANPAEFHPSGSFSTDGFQSDNCDLWLAKELERALGYPCPGDNCFSITRRYFEESFTGRAMTADQMLNWVSSHFMQISTDAVIEYVEPVLILVWSRNLTEALVASAPKDLKSLIPEEQQREVLLEPNIQRLAKRRTGFPEGWVLEHSLVMIEPYRQGATRVFEKESPNDDALLSVLTLEEAIAPYLGRSGLSLTLHLKADPDLKADPE